MLPIKSVKLYDEVVRVTYEYLGPAANRFVERQIKNHLRKRPEQLKKKDLKVLIDWIRLAMNLLSDDEKIVDKYISELKELAHGTRPESK
ncbi:MAG: hypothetical protein ABI220_05220 [Candidatus Saccharimonadales bacterium]